MEPKPGMWVKNEVVTKNYETCLNPDFDNLPPEQIYREYEMDVPEEVLEFCRQIESVGGKALLVGGCVRDMIISAEGGKGKIAPQDIDIEVYGIHPKDLLKEVKKKYKLKENKETVGNKFELITVESLDGLYKFDISIPREDNKTGVGNKGFETTSHPEFTIKEGGRRRDTTCNSMAYDPLTKITYDPFGGKQDILDGVLRATDEEKFIEDPVRILRLMRFAARYDWKIAPETEALCIWMMDKAAMSERKIERVKIAREEGNNDIANEIEGKSAIELDDEVKERIYLEFSKMFMQGGKPSVGLEFIRRVGVIDRYFPWLAELTATEQEPNWHPEGNTWKHTLQVADAAALIAKREGLSGKETLLLLFSALDHDLGKPTKTQKKIKNGVEVISSDGHDMEGGWLSEEFIHAFAPKGVTKIARNEEGEYLGLEETEQKFEKDLRMQARILTEKHMQLKAWYLEYLEIQKKNPEKAEKQSRKWLAKLSRKLAENKTNIYMLAYLTEADQRGRNGESSEPLRCDQVEQLEDWQKWAFERVSEVKIEKELPRKIVDGEKLKKAIEMRQGVELGVVDSWLFDDQLAGEFVNIEDGIERAKVYKNIVVEVIEAARVIGWKTQRMAGNGKFCKLEDEVCRWLKEDGVREAVIANQKEAISEKIGL